MSRSLRISAVGTVTLAVLYGASGAAYADSPCRFITKTEASRLLGVTAGARVTQKATSAAPGCLISAAHGADATLTLSVITLSREEVRRRPEQHADDERGEEVQSLHDEAWYEVSVPDPKHPYDRRLVIHRDRTSLTLDLHSRHQGDAKRAFESVWYTISERLPFDQG